MCIVLPFAVSFAYAQSSGFAHVLHKALFMPLSVGFAYVSVGFAYSDLNKSFIPPMLPNRFVASYGR